MAIGISWSFGSIIEGDKDEGRTETRLGLEGTRLRLKLPESLGPFSRDSDWLCGKMVGWSLFLCLVLFQE